MLRLDTKKTTLLVRQSPKSGRSISSMEKCSLLTPTLDVLPR